ncbi:hypothetical protein [Methylocella sp. CPCC 101449]|uniref:hypothetical protein n=1 Tax=Methylocella sp. CPCC 101449 TaxID=2987531 RepID=UPI00288DF264|nr:hypothetical protein [Methylocella sp. CPCC 101449]MDT2024536.1 hypothetical protein [Methylocella sp. CPCC 101449]
MPTASNGRYSRRDHFFARNPDWTEREDNFIRENYPDYEKLTKKLSGRSYNAIRNRCRVIGVSRRLESWTAAEKLRLRKLWPKGSKRDLGNAFPNRTHSAIRSMAQAMKLTKRLDLFRTNVPLVDDIRQRARSLGYTMSELDTLARSGRFFAAGCIKGSVPRPQYIEAAVRRLGGRLTVVWKES